jgi:hypothetical protein
MEYARTLATPAAESFARVILSYSGWPAVHPVVLIPVIVANHMSAKIRCELEPPSNHQSTLGPNPDPSH